MAQVAQEVFYNRERSKWLRMRTLVVLRWCAIFGQVCAVLGAIYLYDLTLQIGLVSLVIGAPIIVNIVSYFLYPENRRLTESEADLLIGFDLVQLGLLLFLTGGLNNPFALLILAPIAVAATILPLRSMIILSAIAVGIVTLLRFTSLPILTASETAFILPDIFVFGFWVSLIIGIGFISVYSRQVTQETLSMGEALVATQMALAREQKLTDLGGVVAAAAHELGTPLATIKLVSGEIIDDIDPKSDLHDDLTLIRDQADRCRDILHSMGRAGKEDNLLRYAPLESVIKEASEPHLSRGKAVNFQLIPPQTDEKDPAAARQPDIFRRPEIIHGVRNLVQNAVDFARTTVHVEIRWTPTAINIRISDDGAGYSSSVLNRIGEPFVKRKRALEDRKQRPGYEGMGLGLFIAKTLLERSGARLTFSNGGARAITGEPGGAIIELEWPRAAIEVDFEISRGALGENEVIA